MNPNLINSLVVGDAREVLESVQDESVDLVVTSPPYWTAVEYDRTTDQSVGPYDQYISSLLEVWKQCARVLRPNGKLAINTPILPIPKRIIKNQHTRHIKNINNDLEQTILGETSLERFSLFVWQKQTSKMMFGSYPYPGNIIENNTVEFISVYVKPGKPPKFPEEVRSKNKISQREWLDLTQQVWFMYPQDVKRIDEHPAPFPEKLPGRLIRMYTYGSSDDFEGELILDPFCGTGTTCAVARRMGRRYLGIDISERYIDFARKRLILSEFTPPPLLLVGRPKYPTSEELRQVGEEPCPLVHLSKESVKNKHHRETYGRSLDNTDPAHTENLDSPSQRRLFSLPQDTAVGSCEQRPSVSSRNQDGLAEEKGGTTS